MKKLVYECNKIGCACLFVTVVRMIVDFLKYHHRGYNYLVHVVFVCRKIYGTGNIIWWKKESQVRKQKTENYYHRIIHHCSYFQSETSLTAPDHNNKNALIADYLCGSPCHLDIHRHNISFWNKKLHKRTFCVHFETKSCIPG